MKKKIVVYPRHLKKNSILSHIAKKLQARKISQNCLSEKAPGSKKFFFDILKTVHTSK